MEKFTQFMINENFFVFVMMLHVIFYVSSRCDATSKWLNCKYAYKNMHLYVFITLKRRCTWSRESLQKPVASQFVFFAFALTAFTTYRNVSCVKFNFVIWKKTASVFPKPLLSGPPLQNCSHWKESWQIYFVNFLLKQFYYV